MKLTIKNEELKQLNQNGGGTFPKYTSQLINWANQNAQGTRPRVVGQLSDLFPQFVKESKVVTIDEWKAWYMKRYPNAIEDAASRIYAQVENLREAIKLIDRDLVRTWVEDLVISKTYNGLYVQNAILKKLAIMKNSTSRLACPQEEARGIDGFVGDTAYSIKPDTYKTMGRLSEIIDVKMIYYKKNKTGLQLEVEE